MNNSPPNDIKLPPSIEKYVKEDAPLEAKLMASRGLLPLEPKDLITLLYILLFDSNPLIREEANKSIENIPKKILENVLATDLHPAILDYFAKNDSIEEVLLETIIKNRNTADETIAYLANGTSPRILEPISINQERMLKSTEIMENLLNNPNLSRVAQDKVLSLYQTNVLSKGIDAHKDEFIKLEEELTEEKIPLPKTKIIQKEYVSNILDEKRLSIFKKIKGMKLSEKIRFALFGGMEARNILIRDPNKMVAKSVIKSPKITETEILSLSQSRNIDEEILKLIGESKEWVKNYQIKSNLVSNPKTPLSTALKFLSHIRENDLRKLAKSRDVQVGVQTAARKILLSKK